MGESEYLWVVMVMMVKEYEIGVKVKRVNVGFVFVVGCVYVLKEKNGMMGDFLYDVEKKVGMIESLGGIKKMCWR